MGRNNWGKIILSPQEYQKVRSLLDKLYRNITSRSFLGNDFSLYFGSGGVCLFLYYYQKCYGTLTSVAGDIHIPLDIYDQLDLLQESANSYHPEYLQDLTRYAELGILLSHLSKIGLSGVDVEDIYKNLDDNLIKIVPHLAQERALDLLGGVVSIGIYYYLRYDQNPKKYSKVLSSIIDIIASEAMIIEDGVAWSTIIDTSTGQVGFNLGLAHGIPGILAFLRLMFSLGISVRKTKLLIHGAARFLLSQMHMSQNSESIFYDICNLKYEGESSRLSWCYGDLGISIIFILLSKTKGLGLSSLKDTALNILEHTLKRTTRQKAHVRDAGLCHGCFGIAHIYNRAFHLTGELFLKETAIHWYQEGLLMSNKTRGEYEGFDLPFFGDSDSAEDTERYNLSFQTGISGIGLALMAYIEKEEPTWDSLILLS
jgi:lantibiotic biosynthesis protein